ncbi:polysaccharide deacetylase family protein [Streptomyces sp. NPDC002851]
MKNDELLLERRVLLRGAALLAVATMAGCVGTDRARAPSSTSPAAAGARGAPAARPHRHSAYRLRPMTGYGPQRAAPMRTAVRSKPILRSPDHSRQMVLTFDDGPDPRYTPGILRTLRKHDVRAMFFVCGEMVEASPDLLRATVDEGHTIGNHTWAHPELPRLSRERVRQEIERTSEIVAHLVGRPPLWFRAPYGAWDRGVFEIGAELGMEPLAWTVDTLDWREPGTGTIVRRVLGGAGPGVVVLSHDAGGDRSQSVAALNTYLPRLLDEGYAIGVPNRYEM